MPDTWKAYAKEVLGYVPEMTIVNEEYVTAKMFAKWYEEGKTIGQIALKWNAGGATECSSGVNRFGFRYDSCNHQAKVVSYFNQN